MKRIIAANAALVAANECADGICPARDDLYLMHLGSAVKKGRGSTTQRKRSTPALGQMINACYRSTTHSNDNTDALTACVQQRMNAPTTPQNTELAKALEADIQQYATTCPCASSNAQTLISIYENEIDRTMVEFDSIFKAMQSNVSLVLNADTSGIIAATGAQILGTVAEIAGIANMTATPT